MKINTFFKSRLIIIVLFLTSILLITNSCKKASDTPGTNEVYIQGMAFSPSTITVTAGTTITWTNKDGVAHSVTSNSAAFDSGTINTNGTYTHLFSAAGTFPYHCMIHPDMTATVIVN